MKPVCLFPSRLQHVLPATLSELFQVEFYDDIAAAWRIAEVNDTRLFISIHEEARTQYHSILCGLHALHPDMVHLMVADQLDASELVAIINLSGRIRVCHNNDLERELSRTGADCYALYLASSRKDRQIEALTEANEQYEFMLRHSLLS